MGKDKKAVFLLVFIFITVNLFCQSLKGTEDRNNDGKPDRWIYVKSDGSYIIESDNNYDGKIDYILETDKLGNKVYEAMDFGYTGKMNNFYYYKNGALERQEIDSNNDGKIDIWIYLEKGIYITKIERDTKHTGVIDYVKVYKK